MTYLPGRSAAAALVSAAIGMRMFWGLAVDFPFAMNASWLCPLLGMLIYLPLGSAIHQTAKNGSGSVWENLTGNLPSLVIRPAEALLALLLVYDASVVVRMTASSANLVALNNITVHILIFPLSLVIAAVVLLGGDAAGGSGRLWIRILPLLALIVFFVQVKGYRFGWLTPLLGGGLNSIISGSIYCAGCLSLASLSWIVAVPDRNKHSILFYTALTSAVVALLMIAQHMSFPAMINIPFTRAARIELILSNGRMSLSPQLVLDILWFGGLLQLISAEVVTAAAYIHLALKKLPRWLIGVSISVLITLCALYNPEWLRNSAGQTQLQFLEIGALFGILMTAAQVQKGVKKRA